MTDFRSRGKGSSRRSYPITQASVAPRIAKSSGSRHPGKVKSITEYLWDKYGREAFHEHNGTIKMEYLDRAIREAHDDHRLTLERQLIRTKELIEGSRKRAERSTPKEGHAHPARASTEEKKWLEDHKFRESTKKPGLYYKNQGVFFMMVDLRDGKRTVYAEAKQKNPLPEDKRLEAARKFARDHPELKLKAINKDEVRRNRERGKSSDETYVPAHESHSIKGKPEEVSGHEMRLPSYEGGPSTKLTTEDRHKLPASAFAEPGRRAYPIPSKEQLQEYLGWSPEKARKGAERHAINALARAEQHASPEEKREIRRKIHQNVPEVDGAVMKKGFTPVRKGETRVKEHEQPAYYVPPHISHSKDGKIEHVEGHDVPAHEVSGYEEEYNHPE